jgi:hypothetical protein
MRILWLKSDLLLPLDKGGRLRTWHLMRHLAKRHDITYLSFAENGQESETEGMRELAADVVTVPRTDPAKRSLLFYMDAARYLADPLPYAVAKYRSAAYKSKLMALLRDRQFELIVCDFLVPAVNLPKSLPCPAVIFTHNVEAEIWRRHAETKSSVPARWLYRLQHQRMLRFEDETLRRFDGVLAVSDADRETFARLYPEVAGKPMWVVRTGVDTEYFVPANLGGSASRFYGFNGLVTERRRDEALLRRHPAPDSPAGAARYAVDRRPRAHAGGESARRRRDRSYGHR